LFVFVCMDAFVCVSYCVCVFVCVREREFVSLHAHTRDCARVSCDFILAMT